MLKIPASFVTTGGWLTPVPLSFTTTVTPGMTPPSLSTTTPDNGDAALPLWASAGDAIVENEIATNPAINSRSRLRLMNCSFIGTHTSTFIRLTSDNGRLRAALSACDHTPY